MLYHLIRLWFKRQLMWVYYKNTTVNRKQVSDDVRYARSLQVLEGYWSPVTSNADYSKYLLGHYVLNIAANHSRQAFKKLVSCAPLLYQDDETKLLPWIGAKAWSDSTEAIWSNYADGVLYTIFGITGLAVKKIDINSKTELKLLDNIEMSIEVLGGVMYRLLSETMANIQSYTAENNPIILRQETKKLKAISKVAMDYQMDEVIAYANKIIVLLNEVENKG